MTKNTIYSNDVAIISRLHCDNCIIKYLKALQEHLSSQLTGLLSGGPGYGGGGGPFCDLAKWSRFGSECIHEEEAQLHQPLGHMIPTKHAAQANV